ncbi:flagellar hook-associated protein FlgL [Christensenella intestinihominis]|uniref:flagellar hook-associated protein FlgL n=1 Tax=Christensenella intestinihominis TaxID=1851429 RepID=UPI000832D583|nr:flagellar hook-associated protein FlgL [Christensenella intestinihominis]
MRITNSMMIDNLLSNLNSGLRRVGKYNDQLSSNRKIVKLSDDPVGVLNSLNARQQIRRLQQYQNNVTSARSWVTQTETALTEMEQVVINMKELVTAAAGVKHDEDKKIYGKQIAELTEQLLETCNSVNGDRYVFAGFNTTNAPFVAQRDENGNLTGVLYNGLDLSKSGKNVQPDQPIADTANASGFAWTGVLSAPDTYAVTSAANRVTFTDSHGNSSVITIDATGWEAGKDSKIELKDADGKSFGTLSWTNGTTVPTADEIAGAIASAGTVQTRSIANGFSNPVMGPDAQGAVAANGLSWTGQMGDEMQKYTLEADGDQIRFINSYGSVEYVHTVDAAEIAAKEIDLSADGFGIISWTADSAVDPHDPAKDTIEKSVAQMVASAGFVTTKLGEEATQDIQFEIGYNMMFDVSFTGIDVVGTGDDNMFNILIDLKNVLQNGGANDEISQYLSSLSGIQDRLLTCMVGTGTRTTKLDAMVNRYSLDAINYEAIRSNIEDIDQAQTIMNYKYSEAIFKQALASGAQIIQPTLMDFLR